MFHIIATNPAGSVTAVHIITKLQEDGPASVNLPGIDEYAASASFSEWHKHLAVIIVTSDVFELMASCLAFRCALLQHEAAELALQAKGPSTMAVEYAAQGKELKAEATEIESNPQAVRHTIGLELIGCLLRDAHAVIKASETECVSQDEPQR